MITTLFGLYLIFAKIGLFTIGGGYAMIPLIQEEITSRGWLTQGELIDFIAVSESTPGTFAVNISTYIGSQVCSQYGVFGQILGGALATLGVITPSFLIILLVAKFYRQFKESRAVSGVMSGLRPTVIGLIAAALINLCGTVFFPTGFSFNGILSVNFISSAIIFAVCLVLIFKKLHPIFMILIAAAAGLLTGVLQETVLS